MKVAIIGSGHIGAALAGLLSKAGDTITFGADDIAAATKIAADLGVRVAAIDAAIASAEAVIVAIPFKAWPDVARAHGAALAGKAVLDTTNTNAERDGGIVDEVARAGQGTLAFVAALLPGARLVKAFNTMESDTLAKGADQPGGRLAHPLAGDDPAAVGVAARLVGHAGFDPVFVGDAASAQAFDQGTPVWNAPRGASELAQALGVVHSPAYMAHAFFAAYAQGDADAMAALCSPDATIDYVPMAAEGRGSVGEVGLSIWRGYFAAFEQFTPEIDDMWVDAARATAIVRTTNRGRQRAETADIAPSGGMLAAPHLFLIGLGPDDRIARVSAWWDNFTIYSQLGYPKSLPSGQAHSA